MLKPKEENNKHPDSTASTSAEAVSIFIKQPHAQAGGMGRNAVYMNWDDRLHEGLSISHINSTKWKLSAGSWYCVDSGKNELA